MLYSITNDNESIVFRKFTDFSHTYLGHSELKMARVFVLGKSL